MDRERYNTDASYRKRIEAARRGGRSRSVKKVEAARRNAVKSRGRPRNDCPAPGWNEKKVVMREFCWPIEREYQWEDEQKAAGTLEEAERETAEHIEEGQGVEGRLLYEQWAELDFKNLAEGMVTPITESVLKALCRYRLFGAGRAPGETGETAQAPEEFEI